MLHIQNNKTQFSNKKWENIKLQDFITLMDMQSLEESIKENSGVDGIEYQVSNILNYQICDPEFKEVYPIRYKFIELTDTKDKNTLQLVIRMAKDGLKETFDFKILYSQTDAYPYANRKMLVEKYSCKFLFCPPSDFSNFSYISLDYTDTLGPLVFNDDGTQETEVLFEKKDFGILYGLELKSCEMSLIIEYSQKPPTYKNPLILIREDEYVNAEGQLKKDGGCLAVLFGCEIKEHEIKL